MKPIMQQVEEVATELLHHHIYESAFCIEYIEMRVTNRTPGEDTFVKFIVYVTGNYTEDDFIEIDASCKVDHEHEADSYNYCNICKARINGRVYGVLNAPVSKNALTRLLELYAKQLDETLCPNYLQEAISSRLKKEQEENHNRQKEQIEKANRELRNLV